MATKAFKNEKIESMKESIAKAKVAIVTNYRGFSVEEITNLRRELQKEGADYSVTKNTLAKIAVQGTGYEGLSDLLEGPTAVAFGFVDQVAPAKVLTQFIKKAKKGEIVGGVIDGKVLSAKEVQKLSELPSKEELYAKMLGSINSPATGLVMAMSGVARKLVYAMEEIRKQKSVQG